MFGAVVGSRVARCKSPSRERCERKRERDREAKELHDEHHPPVAIKFGTEPLVASPQGRTEFRFHVAGALIGFNCAARSRHSGHRVIQQQEISFSPTDDSASNEITAELDIMCIICTRHYKTNHIRLAIGVWDAHACLSQDEALVARKDATSPLKCEHVLSTDNGCRLVRVK